MSQRQREARESLRVAPRTLARDVRDLADFIRFLFQEGEGVR